MAVHKSKKRVLSLTCGAIEWCLLCLLVLVLMCGGSHQYTLGTMTSWTVGQTITGNDFRTVQVRTKSECALVCVVDASCGAAAVDCQSSPGTATFDCELKYASLTPYMIVANSDMCYSLVQSRGEYVNGVNVNDLSTTTAQPAAVTTTVPALTTVPTSSVSPQVAIRAGVGNLNNMCSSTSSTDIALITDDGVYIYDNMASLMTGACSGPHLLATIFLGYSGTKSLPAIWNIICLMVHQNTDIDMFDNNQVWRWQVDSGALYGQSSQSYPKDISARLGVTYAQIPPANSNWCVNRDRNGRQDVFFHNNDMLYYYSTQNPTIDSYAPSMTGKSNNGYNLNPWTKLPSETVTAVISLTTNSDDFVMIGESRTLYRYQMDHSSNSNDPPTTVTTLGTLVI